MIALNNIIARAKGLHVRYLIEKGILLLILPFVHSLSTRLRLQALWIIGNLGTFDGQEGFKSAVLATDAVATMVQVRVLVRYILLLVFDSVGLYDTDSLFTNFSKRNISVVHFSLCIAELLLRQPVNRLYWSRQRARSLRPDDQPAGQQPHRSAVPHA